MRFVDFIILISILLCPVADLNAQSTVKVSKPVLSMNGNKVQISYDLLNSAKEDIYTIRIEVTDSKGQSIDARSLSGDIGDNIMGGGNKKILWDIEADSIFLDDEIFVQVYALPAPVPVDEEVLAEEPPLKEPVKESVEESPKETMAGSTSREYNRTAIILQSVAFPGLGLSRTNPGQPHWIKGVAGYGCIAGSIYFNKKAISSYSAYENPDNLDEVDDLFNQAVRQDNISEALAFIAIGIWVTDLVWTIVGTSDLKNDQPAGDSKGFSIGTSVEPVSSVPLIAFRYRF